MVQTCAEGGWWTYWPKDAKHGKRKRGRPQRSFRDAVKEDMARHGVAKQDATGDPLQRALEGAVEKRRKYFTTSRLITY